MRVHTLRLWGLLALLASLVSLRASAEGVYHYEGERSPHYAAPRATDARPRLALVLGSGGRRGFAHAGALRALEAAHIKPDLIVGVSIGSVIGALYAAGTPAAEIEQLALQLDLSTLRDLSWLHWGQVRGQKLENFVNEHVRNRSMEALGIPFAVVVTRQNDSAMHIFNRGDTGVAVRTSSAVPGRFFAVNVASVTYVDGDVASPVPVRAARMLGAEVVVAVDISANLDKVPALVPNEWLRTDRSRRQRIDAESSGADVLIHPNLGYFAGTSGDYRKRVIAAAEEATRAAVPRIRAALAEAQTKRAASAAPAPVPAPAPATAPAPAK